jgi:hypothetical protein
MTAFERVFGPQRVQCAGSGEPEGGGGEHPRLRRTTILAATIDGVEASLIVPMVFGPSIAWCGAVICSRLWPAVAESSR